MVAWVVGPDQGPTPPDLSSCSLLQWRRERAWYMQKKFALHTSPWATEWQNFRGICDFLNFHIRTHCICNEYKYIILYINLQPLPEWEQVWNGAIQWVWIGNCGVSHHCLELHITLTTKSPMSPMWVYYAVMDCRDWTCNHWFTLPELRGFMLVLTLEAIVGW